MDSPRFDTAIPRDEPTANLSADNTIISKIGAYSDDNYSYFSKDGIKTNIEKDKVVPVMFGIDGDSRNTNSFDANGYKNEKFVESRCAVPSWERVYAIEKFDEGIVVGENNKILTKISTEPYSLGDYKSPTEKKTYKNCSVGTAGSVSLVYFSQTYNNEKYEFAFPFRGDTLYIGSFYTSKYINGVPSGYVKQEIGSGTDVNFFLSINDERPSKERNRNTVALSFNDIPENAKFIGHKLFITPQNNSAPTDTVFYKNSIFASKGYIKYCVLCFESGVEIYEIGFKVNTDKYFYPTIAEPEDEKMVSIIYGKNNDGGYSVKYCCEFTKAQQSATKSSLKNVIAAFYMNDKPSKLKGNGVWAAKSDAADSYPIRYLKTSRDCYFKLEVKANTELDPAKTNDGTWKDFTICSSGFDDSFKNAMVREYKTWKRWDGNNTFEYGDGIAGYEQSTGKKQTAKNVRPVKLLSAGATVNYDDKLYDVTYKKISTKNSWGAVGDPCLYVKNGKLFDGDSRECAKGNPFEGSTSNLSSKFEALSVLKGHEGGAIEYFYSCQAGVITYGVGFTWVSAKKENEGELEQWRKFFKAAKANNDIKISLKHSSLVSFNTGAERSGAINELYQDSADGQIYFRKISTKELLKSVYPWKGATALPVVSVPSSHIETKFKALAVEYAGYVYNETMRKIETVKNPDGSVGSLANVDFDRWVGDKNGTYTIRSRITQEQWDYMVDARYQGNGDFFKYLRGGTTVDSGTGVKCTYKEFCQRALNGIEHENAYQKEHPDKNYFLRNSEWRNGPLKRVFSNIPPEEAVPSASNEQDNTVYYAHEITISCHSMGRGKIDTVMLESDSSNKGANPRSYISYYSKKAVGLVISENEDDIVYYMTSYREEDAKNDAKQAVKVSQDDMDWGRFKDIVNRWSCKITDEGDTDKDGKKIVQKLIGVDRYYDFYTGMTPFIQAYFRDGVGGDGKATKWNILNSLQHPYFKSLTVEDKGVKTATLTLFDKDFGSYQYGVVVDSTTDDGRIVDSNISSNSNKNVKKVSFGKKVYSLETIIKKALVQNSAADVNDSKRSTVRDDSSDGANDGNSYKDFTEEELKDTYLKYDEYKSADPTNLRIRFGYADDNPPVTDDQFKGDESEEGYKNYNNLKYGGTTSEKTGKQTGESVRDYRWYDVRNPGKERSMEVKPKVYFDGSSIVEGGGKVTIASTDTKQIDNTLGKELNEEEKVNKHRDITTLKSYVRNYMIIGYETSLKPNGIQYTIKAVETGYASLMRKRFLQRYHELTSNPIEVLAALMTIFNEPQQGKPNTKSGFKLYYAIAPDEDAENAADTLNMLFDFGSLSDEDREKYNWAKDSYTVNTMNKEGLKEFGREIYKKITVKLGGESALGNMAREANYGKPALYKSVASLIDEFCSACPSKKFGLPNSDTKAYDKDGNEITNDSYESQARLGWFLGKYEGGGKQEELCVVLYYKRPRRLGRIRVYRWGPELPYKTVVKSLNVKNNNEFAILSAVDTFEEGTNGATIRCKINARNMNLSKANASDTKLISHDLAVTRSFKDLAKELDNGGAEIVSYVAPNKKEANKYDLAFSSCMYTGTMEMLGDPSLEFNMLLQPYTYPIRLEVYVPRNELAFKARDWGVADTDEENKDAQRNSNEINIFNKIKDAENEYGARENVGLHQVHEMSGYYVITSITHNISSNGYTTTLGIASYPNIEKDVLYVDSDGIPIQPDYLF